MKGFFRRKWPVKKLLLVVLFGLSGSFVYTPVTFSGVVALDHRWTGIEEFFRRMGALVSWPGAFPDARHRAGSGDRRSNCGGHARRVDAGQVFENHLI